MEYLACNDIDSTASNFHEDWNLLIEVIEVIKKDSLRSSEDLKWILDENGSVITSVNMRGKINKALLRLDIDETHKAVYNYIEWIFDNFFRVEKLGWSYLEKVLWRNDMRNEEGEMDIEFVYPTNEIVENMDYINFCERNGMSPYKCLTFLSAYLDGDYDISRDFKN